jgi:hypothetical protein
VQRRIHGEYVALLGAVAVLGACWLPWAGLPGGRELHGFGLADAIMRLGRMLDVVPSPWLGALWYAIPLSAAVALVAVGWLPNSARRAIVAVAAAGALVLSVTAAVVLGGHGVGRVSGPLVAAMGSVLLGATCLPMWRPSEKREQA